MPEDHLFRSTLPPGRHKLPRDFVARHQKDRLFAALVELVDEHGYPSVSLTQIVKRAGVARHTFYEHFEDKEALYLALFDATAERSYEIFAAAMEAEEGPWELRIRAGFAAFLAEAAAAPALTRVCLIESQSAGRASVARRVAAMRRFGEKLKEGRGGVEAGAQLPDSLEDILLGGVAFLLGKRLVADEASVTALLPEIVELLVPPYRGNKVAAQVAALGPADDGAPGPG